MRKLAYIFGITLFLFGCATRNYILNVSYDPIDYPPQFFSPKDQRPVLYIDPVVDKREFAPELEGAGSAKGRFKEDPALILSYRYSCPSISLFTGNNYRGYQDCTLLPFANGGNVNRM